MDDLGLNWDSFKWRNHQPDIGRFFNVDPLAESYYYNSPYAFSENKVTTHIELEGLEAEWIGDLGEHVSQDPDGAAAGASGFVVGVYNSTLGGIVDMITDPIGTIESISKMAPGNLEGMVESATNMVAGGLQKADQLQNGNAFEKGVIAGEVAGTAASIAYGAKTGPKGIIYERIDKTSNLKPYVGQTKSAERFAARQKEHARANPRSDFEFKKIDKGKPGKNLDKKEQKALDARGGPTNKSNPNGGTSNKKNVIKKKN